MLLLLFTLQGLILLAFLLGSDLICLVLNEGNLVLIMTVLFLLRCLLTVTIIVHGPIPTIHYHLTLSSRLTGGLDVVLLVRLGRCPVFFLSSFHCDFSRSRYRNFEFDLL